MAVGAIVAGRTLDSAVQEGFSEPVTLKETPASDKRASHVKIWEPEETARATGLRWK